MKTCPYCQTELPDEANFCPACARTLQEPQELSPVSVHTRGKWIPVILSLLLLAGVTLFLQLKHRPRSYDDGETARIVYQSGPTSYTVILRNSAADPFHWREAQNEYVRKVKSGTIAAIPLQLYVYDGPTGENLGDTFDDLLERSEISIEARSQSKAAEASTPAPNPAFEGALLESDIVFDTDCYDNQVAWTLFMKNGDTLVLHMTISIQTIEEAAYSYTTTPLTTMEELQALIDDIGQTLAPDVYVTITLAPIVYEGTLSLENQAICLAGSITDEGQTVIRGTVRNRAQMASSFEHLRFEGEGSGSGLVLESSAFIEECTFSGLDTGILGLDGSWPMPLNCTFEDCRIGIHFNSSTCQSKNAWWDGMTFIHNETAVLLEQLPSDDILYFTNFTFENNGTDIDNRAGNEIRDRL